MHRPGAGLPVGALHAVEFRDGRAVTYRWSESDADASVFWHAGSVLALSETGLPSQYSRLLEPQEFAGALSVPIASHAHRVAADGTRVVFAVDDRGRSESSSPELAEGQPEGTWLRIGEWDARGALRRAQAIELERCTWQHDVAVTSGHVVFIESPTTRLAAQDRDPVPYCWVPGAEGWLGVVPRDGDGTDVRWFRLDPCLVTHVLGAWEEAAGDIVLFVCRYDALEDGRPYDPAVSVVGPQGVGLTSIGGTLAVLERWRITADRVERALIDDRFLEYPRMDASLEGAPFRHGYSVELDWADSATGTNPARAREGAGASPFAIVERGAAPIGLLKFDLARDEAVAWHPGPGRRPSEPLFVRAVDGHGDEEGWLLSVVDDANRGASDIYVLDASSMGRRGPEAVIHLPVRLPLRSHGEWVPADRYR
jgi:carotenoid cleavage dioxygenase